MSNGIYTITTDHERHLVYVLARGEFDRDLGEALITDARTDAAMHRYNILCDVTHASIKVNLSDWFFLPRRLGVYNNPETRYIKTAIVVNNERQGKVFAFFETVTNNLGLNIRVFYQEATALEWLSSEWKIANDDKKSAP